MSYQVFLTDDAAYDLEVLYEYIETHDVPKRLITFSTKLRKHF
jgi:toxin ParE1/3/4